MLCLKDDRSLLYVLRTVVFCGLRLRSLALASLRLRLRLLACASEKRFTYNEVIPLTRNVKYNRRRIEWEEKRY